MDKRTAKREACARVADLICGTLGGAWDTLDMYGDDRDVVEAAIEELRSELDRRSAGRTQ